MAAKLIAEEGALRGLVLSLENGEEWVIGRDPDSCQLLIEDPTTSRRHLICRATPEGIVIENLSATNPVQVNYEEIKKPRLLHHEDLVKIGNGLFRFYSESEMHLFNEEESLAPLSQPHEEEDLNASIHEEDNSEPENREEEHHEEDNNEPENREEEHHEEEGLNASIHEEDNNEPENHEEEHHEEENLYESVKHEDNNEPENHEEEHHEEENLYESVKHEDVIEPENREKEETNDLAAMPPSNETPISSDDSEFPEEIFSDEKENQDNLSSTHYQPYPHESIYDEDKFTDKGLFAEIDFNIEEIGRWLLKVIGGPNNGAEITMKSGSTYILGTDPSSSDIVFNDTSISRQHARITINNDDILTIEDLHSRNGTLVDGKPLEGKLALETNVVVNLGTSAFVVYDKEGEMHTIISPLLPSIVKVLQKEEHQEPIEQTATEPSPEEAKKLAAQQQEISDLAHREVKERNKTTLTAFIFIAIITGTFVLMGIGIVTLFQTNPVVLQEDSDTHQLLSEALAPFPSIEWIFNKSTGSLLLVGHVLTDDARRQLLYNLEGFHFIKNIDSRDIIIDERVWQDLNQNLSRNPAWRGIHLQANTPGQFVISGYLKTRDQLDTLAEYLSRNFLYNDILQYHILVEENVLASLKTDLTEKGIMGVTASMDNRVLILQGTIPNRLHAAFQEVLANNIKKFSLKNVQNYVVEVPEASTTQDISNRYLVTGVSRSGNNISVIIDGRILSKGDTLDNMTIVEINSQYVLLEKDGIKYKISIRP